MNCALLCKLLDELPLEFSFGNGKKKPGNGLCMFVVLKGKVLQNANGIEFHKITIRCCVAAYLSTLLSFMNKKQFFHKIFKIILRSLLRY